MKSDESEDILDVFMTEFQDLKDWIDAGKRPKDFPGSLSAIEDNVKNRLATQRINIDLPSGFKEAWAEYQATYSHQFRIEAWTEEHSGPLDLEKQQKFKEWLDGLIQASNYDDLAEVMQIGTGYASLRKSFWRWDAVEDIFPIVPKSVDPENYQRHHIFGLIQQAHRAIVFGAPFAAMAAMRAALEDLLANWLKVPGKDLKEMLDDETVLDVKKSSRKNLHLLRKRANAALHIGGHHHPKEKSFVVDLSRMASGELSDAEDMRIMNQVNIMLSEINALVESIEP